MNYQFNNNGQLVSSEFINSAANRELQKALKSKVYHSHCQVKLNSKKEVLQQELVRINKLIEKEQAKTTKKAKKEVTKKEVTKKEDIKELASSTLNSTHNKIKQKENNIKQQLAFKIGRPVRTIGTYLTNPDGSYNVILKDGTTKPNIRLSNSQSLATQTKTTKTQSSAKATETKAKTKATETKAKTKATETKATKTKAINNRSELHNWKEVWNKEQIKNIRPNTNNSKVILYMHKNNGITLEDYQKLGLPSKRQVSQSIAVISEKGYGINFDGTTYKLVLPKDMTEPLVNAK